MLHEKFLQKIFTKNFYKKFLQKIFTKNFYTTHTCVHMPHVCVCTARVCVWARASSHHTAPPLPQAPTHPTVPSSGLGGPQVGWARTLINTSFGTLSPGGGFGSGQSWARCGVVGRQVGTRAGHSGTRTHTHTQVGACGATARYRATFFRH